MHPPDVRSSIGRNVDCLSASGGLLLGLGFLEDPHDVAFLHDEVLDAIDLDLGARPLAEQDAVAGPDGMSLPVSSRAAGSNGDDLALLRLILGGVGNVFDPASFRSMTTRS